MSLYTILLWSVSLNALIGKKPSVIDSRWQSFVISISCIPVIVLGIRDLIKFGWNGGLSAIFLTGPLLFISLLIFFNFLLKGYSVYCVSDVDFRNAVINSLNNNSIRFEETMNGMKLIDINNELNVSFMSWMGSGMIKIKKRKDKIIFKKIIDGIKIYFKENNITPKRAIAVFNLILGVFFIASGIVLAINS
jgi:hypothetical protein